MIVEVDEIKAEATKAVHAAAEKLQGSAPNVHAHLIESDHVGEGLIEFVEENECDLLVVGETPHSVLGRVILGSVSRFVLRHAPCSVWITRRKAGRGLGRGENPFDDVSRCTRSEEGNKCHRALPARDAMELAPCH